MINALPDNKAIQYQGIDHGVMSGPLFTYTQCTYRLIIYTHQQVNKSSVIALLNGRQASAPWILKNAPRAGRKDYRSPTQSPENNKIKDLQAMTG